MEQKKVKEEMKSIKDEIKSIKALGVTHTEYQEVLFFSCDFFLISSDNDMSDV